jgi:aldose 1-epimerase
MMSFVDSVMNLAAGGARAVVAPSIGARLVSLEVDGLELLVEPTSQPLSWGCYPMAPWAGRVRRGRFTFGGNDVVLEQNLPPHAIHGLVATVPWRRDEGRSFVCSLEGRWPFGGHVRQAFDLSANGLRMTLEVHADDRPMPAVCGWHPWFRRSLTRGRGAVYELGPARMYRRDVEGIPDGTIVDPGPGPYDDCFVKVPQPLRLRWPGALELELRSSCDHWVVFDQLQHAICVEPQTGPPDAFNLSPRTVVPGRPLVASFSIRWRVDPGDVRYSTEPATST